MFLADSTLFSGVIIWQICTEASVVLYVIISVSASMVNMLIVDIAAMFVSCMFCSETPVRQPLPCMSWYTVVNAVVYFWCTGFWWDQQFSFCSTSRCAAIHLSTLSSGSWSRAAAGSCPGVFVSLTVVQVWYVTIGRPGVVYVYVFLYCLFVHVCCIKCNKVSWVWYDWELSGWFRYLLQRFDTVGWVIWPLKWDITPYCTQPTNLLLRVTVGVCRLGLDSSLVLLPLSCFVLPSLCSVHLSVWWCSRPMCHLTPACL